MEELKNTEELENEAVEEIEDNEVPLDKNVRLMSPTRMEIGRAHV